MASPAGQDLLVGSELGHYRILEKIDAGGMGEVYRASDQHLVRDVAIKVLPPGTLVDESARKHFHKEALILSQLNHPNIATIHDFDTQQGVDFLVMEYIPGITLSEKLAGRPLPEKEVLRVGVQLAEGLAAAHEQGRGVQPRPILQSLRSFCRETRSTLLRRHLGIFPNGLHRKREWPYTVGDCPQRR